jgi:hypothetical protein
VRKPGWISFCGWASFALLLFAVSLELLKRGQPYSPIPGGVAFLAVLVAIPAAGLWILGSTVHRFQLNGARLKAQAFFDAQSKASSASLVCQCGARSVVHCVIHKVALCPTCWSQHHKADCSYSQVNVPIKPPVAMVR